MIKINKSLEHTLAVAVRKTKTVPRRLPRRLRAGLSNEGNMVFDLISSVHAYVRNKNTPGTGAERLVKWTMRELTTAHAEKARKHWDNIFAKIVPSKQKEAQTAYNQTRATLTMIRALIKQESGGR
jgi:hypothetical protein